MEDNKYSAADETFLCEECGEPCYEDASPNVFLHGDGPGDPEDLDRDLDHVARPEKS